MNYYDDKIESLADVFGTNDISISPDNISVAGRSFPIIDDVIIILNPKYWPQSIRNKIDGSYTDSGDERPFAEMVQFSFGKQWQKFSQITPEHEKEFKLYFDLVDIMTLKDKRCADIGCGIGRWSHFIAPHCREIVLLDFSEAIFVARRNLAAHKHAMFFMGDLTDMPFRQNFADLLYSLGVLHHLKQNCLDLTRMMAPFAPQILVYLYYDLDNRPIYFRGILSIMNAFRHSLSKMRQERARTVTSYALVLFAYLPFILLGRLAALVGWGSRIPLYEFYKDKSFERIRQDAYDRFFTQLEQRASRKDIMRLQDTYSTVTISDQLPYWHFLCHR